MLYYDILPLVEHLKPELQGKLFISALRYAKHGEAPDFSPDDSVFGIWEFMRERIDRDGEAYREKVLLSKYARYCGVEKAKDRIPLDFENWVLWRETLEREELIETD